MWVWWLVIIILLTFLEAMTVNLVSVWFIASAVVSMIISFFIDSFYIEFAVFVVLGLILMLLTRPMLVNKFSKKEVKTNLDRVLGMKGIVTEDINSRTIGEVKVDGKKWSAISDCKIEVGTTIIVDAIDGVKLIVRKEEE